MVRPLLPIPPAHDAWSHSIFIPTGHDLSHVVTIRRDTDIWTESAESRRGRSMGKSLSNVERLPGKNQGHPTHPVHREAAGHMRHSSYLSQRRGRTDPTRHSELRLSRT